MKKILIMLAISGCSYCGAEAQALQSIEYDLTHFNSAVQEDKVINAEQAMRITPCEVSSNKVCKMGSDNKVSCYNTKYSENFKVCKGNSGYFICCETANYSNSTHPAFVVTKTDDQNPNENMQNQSYYYAQNEAVDAANNNAVPQSQSYAGYNIISSHTYQGYYLQNGTLKACYGGNNVGELNRAPYKGCPSPQDDGPEKNIARNLNVVTQ